MAESFCRDRGSQFAVVVLSGMSIWEFSHSYPDSNTNTVLRRDTLDSDDLLEDILVAVVQLQTYKNVSSFCYHLSLWDSAPKEPHT